MSLSEVSKNEKIEIVLSANSDWSRVQVRNATIISRDGVELTRYYKMHYVMPDGDVSAEDADVQVICNVVFTQDCKDNYATWVAARA